MGKMKRELIKMIKLIKEQSVFIFLFLLLVVLNWFSTFLFIMSIIGQDILPQLRTVLNVGNVVIMGVIGYAAAKKNYNVLRVITIGILIGLATGAFRAFSLLYLYGEHLKPLLSVLDTRADASMIQTINKILSSAQVTAWNTIIITPLQVCIIALIIYLITNALEKTNALKKKTDTDEKKEKKRRKKKVLPR